MNAMYCAFISLQLFYVVYYQYFKLLLYNDVIKGIIYSVIEWKMQVRYFQMLYLPLKNTYSC
jgi:hypothetical protein